MVDMIRLGVFISDRKKSRTRLREVMEDLCRQESIHIIDIDLNKSLEAQGPFHVILHKVIDLFHIYPEDEANQKVKKLINYSRKHKDLIVIDDFNWCMKLTKRKCIIELIRRCEFTYNNIKVFLPKTVEITHAMKTHEILSIVQNNLMKYPILVKPCSAALSEECHEMALIFSNDHLSQISQPSFLQEFHNHDGVYYKIFVVGNTFRICEHPSIKDIHEDLIQRQSAIFFNARNISKRNRFNSCLHDNDPNLREWHSSDEVPNMLDKSVIEQLILRMRKLTGFQLMKLDILVVKETGDYAVIDMNQFPSYDGIDTNYLPKNLVRLVKKLGSI